MKKFLIILFVISTQLFAQFKFGEAKGLFFSVEVGPRFPISDFANMQNTGVGVDATFSYTDNLVLPVFIYTTIGYQFYPGRQDLYSSSDYSSFSSNVIIVAPGVRYYFKPILENVVLLMPIVDIGAEFAYFEKLHQYKIGSGKQDHLEDISKFGFHVGAGFSMFILDVITYYNYLPDNQYISFNLRATIPIYIKF
jgi:hypothetical protein